MEAQEEIDSSYIEEQIELYQNNIVDEYPNSSIGSSTTTKHTQPTALADTMELCDHTLSSSATKTTATGGGTTGGSTPSINGAGSAIMVTCPICQIGILKKGYNDTMIYCQYYHNNNNENEMDVGQDDRNDDYDFHNHNQQRTCQFCLRGDYANEMSLDQLRHKLFQKYDEHSMTGCAGMLQFDVMRGNQYCHHVGDDGSGGGAVGGRNEDRLIYACAQCDLKATMI